MANHKKRFCLNNHDTHVVGRLKGRCCECRRDYQRIYNKTPAQKSNVKRWAEANKDRTRNSELQRLYGISLADYKARMASQNELCLICLKKRPLVVDHCHKTGYIRGLLCSTCNRAMGLFSDDPIKLRSAVSYLEQTQ